jgi:hypothetical protein
VPKPRQQSGAGKQQGGGDADGGDLQLPPGMLGAVLGGTQSNRPQRNRRVPAKCLGVPGVLNAAQEWEYHHQAAQQQQQQGPHGGQSTAEQQQQQRGMGSKASTQKPPRARRPAARRSAAKAQQGTQHGPGAAAEQEVGAESQGTHVLEHLPDTFQESGLWGDEGCGDDEEADQGGYSSHPSADDSDELGATTDEDQQDINGSGGL